MVGVKIKQKSSRNKLGDATFNCPLTGGVHVDCLCFRAGHRKQFLIADSRTIYGFVEKGGKKFATDCSSYTDRTCDIQCKVENILNISSL